MTQQPPQLVIEPADSKPVWRVGFTPQPWAWSGWEWATDGRFHGRWDDHEGNFRTVYAGATLLACLLEVLACFRPDPTVAHELADITEGDPDTALHPSASPGNVPYSWLEPRTATTATLDGHFCAVAAAESIAALRPWFVAQALNLGLHDFDAAALKDGRPRELTQAVATHLHATTILDGVTFTSRHGDNLDLWAIFERAGDSAISPTLTQLRDQPLTPDDPDITEAFRIHRLTWSP